MTRPQAALVAILALTLSGCATLGQIADIITRPTPAPTPTPTPTPTQPAIEPPTQPTPQPTPTPGQPFPAGHPAIEPVAGEAGLYAGAVREAAQSVLGCDPGTSGCNWTTPVVPAYDAVTASLRADGYDSGRYDDDHSGPWAGSDAIAVKARDAEAWHEWKLYNYGGLPSGAHPSEFRWTGAFRITGPSAPPPTAEPKPCPKVTSLNLHVQWLRERAVDVTPRTHGREVCEALGFTDGRLDCALGVEIEGQPNPDRIRCETEAGPYTATIDGEEVGPISSNPLVFWAGRAGRFTVCSREMVCNSMVLD